MPKIIDVETEGTTITTPQQALNVLAEISRTVLQLKALADPEVHKLIGEALSVFTNPAQEDVSAPDSNKEE